MHQQVVTPELSTDDDAIYTEMFAWLRGIDPAARGVGRQQFYEIGRAVAVQHYCDQGVALEDISDLVDAVNWAVLWRRYQSDIAKVQTTAEDLQAAAERAARLERLYQTLETELLRNHPVPSEVGSWTFRSTAGYVRIHHDPRLESQDLPWREWWDRWQRMVASVANGRGDAD